METRTLLDFLEKAEGSGKQFSSDELKAMLESVVFDVGACRVILRKIKDQAILLSFLSSRIGYAEYEEKVRIVLSLVDLSTKSNSELLSLFADTKNSKYVVETIADHLNLEGKKESELLDIMSKLGYCRIICAKAIPLLKLKKTKKYQEKIWLLIENSRFNYQVVRRVIRYVLDENRVMELLKREDFSEGMFYDGNLKEGLVTIKGSDNLAEVVASVSDNLALCKHYVSQIKSERERFELARDLDRNSVWVGVIPTLKKKEYVSFACYKVNALDRYDHWNSFYVIAFLPHCKTEEEILKLAKAYSNFTSDKKFLFDILEYISITTNLLVVFNQVLSSEVREKIIVKLNLKTKSTAELWDILTQTNYHENMCEAILPLLGLETKSDEEIIKLLNDKQDNKHLCLSAINYLKSQENRVKVFRYYYDDESYVSKACGYLDQINLGKEFITSFRPEYFLLQNIPKQLIYQRLQADSYPEKLLVKFTNVLANKK